MLYFRLVAFDRCKSEVQAMTGDCFPPEWRVLLAPQLGDIYEVKAFDSMKQRKVAIFAKTDVDEYHVFGKVKIYRFERIEER